MDWIKSNDNLIHFSATIVCVYRLSLESIRKFKILYYFLLVPDYPDIPIRYIKDIVGDKYRTLGDTMIFEVGNIFKMIRWVIEFLTEIK